LYFSSSGEFTIVSSFSWVVCVQKPSINTLPCMTLNVKYVDFKLLN
jgi:hypothetical protein